MIRDRYYSIAVLILLGGCTVGPSYEPPALPTPASFHAGSIATEQRADIAAWWTQFNDPLLTRLIDQALADNLDVRQATSRIQQARVQERITRGSSGPTLNASTQAGYTRLSENSLPSSLLNLGNPNSDQSSSGSGLGLPGESFKTYQVGFDASWEIDLFGGQRRANEAVHARTDAALWSGRDAEVMIAAEVANHYQQYRSLQQRIALADETLGAERELMEVIGVRIRKGLVTDLDENSQRQEVERVAAQIEDLTAQADIHVHALGTLLGQSPDALTRELAGRPAGSSPLVEVPPGLPSDLLLRRPDLRAAERQLAAATADIGEASADLYPKFSLTGALQLVSLSLSSLFESESRQVNGSGRISLPLFDRGVRKSTVNLREAQADEAYLAYQAKVLSALRDVEDSLSRLDADRKRVDHLKASAKAAEDALNTATIRYRNGLTSSVDMLEARQTSLNARDTLEQAEAATAQDVVALYKALGGGWDERRIPAEEDKNNG